MITIAETNRPDNSAKVIEGLRSSRELARSHYENFSVASIILPRHLRQDIFLIYAFARLADDFADELRRPDHARARLDDWERQLHGSVDGSGVDPLFNALGNTIKRHNLPLQPFLDLLTAFRLDTVKSRYETWDELREYTKYSADPVGRLVLALFGFESTEYFALSDKICTALQLTNHWQDVTEDYKRGRIYIPLEDLERFGVTETDIGQSNMSVQFRKLMEFEVNRARALFNDGLPLLKQTNGRCALQLCLYWTGGVEILRKIKSRDYDVLNQKIRFNRRDKIVVGLSALRRWLRFRWE